MRVTTTVRQALVVLVATITAFVTAPTSAQSSVTPTTQIQDFGLVSSQNGWLLAGNHLYWTDSLGSSWTEITPPAADTISAAAFRADGSGWALTSTSGTLAVARTADSGQHWATAAIAPPFTDAATFSGRASLSFADARNGFLMLGLQSGSAFRLGLLMHTTDGGATWQSVATPPIGESLSFISPTRGFNGPGAQGDELYLTTDAATTWQRVTLTVPTALANISSTIELPTFTDATHGTLLRTFATDTTPTVVRYETSDAGLTWTATSAPSPRLTIDAATASRFPSTAGTLLATKSSLFGYNGLALFKSGKCADGTCEQTSALLSTTNGGTSFNKLGKASAFTPESTHTFASPTTNDIPSTISAPDALHPDSSTVYNTTTGIGGYDACTTLSLTQATDWYTNSPFRVAGVYFGGVSFGCTVSPLLTPSYITSITTQGWQVVPIWVGPQGPGACGGSCTHLISTDPTTAQAQGVTEADSAVSAVVSLGGIRQGSTIMYDMEAYSHTVAANAAATRAFLQGWTTELHAKGYLAAVYSSHPEFTDWYPTVVTPDVDIIWFAYFIQSSGACVTDCQNLFPSIDISASYWINHHRARQESGGHNETYGTTTINIDDDWIGAAFTTATSNILNINVLGSGSVASSTITNPNGDQTAFTTISCGSTCNAPVAPTDTIGLTATIPSGLSLSWNNCTTTSGANCTVLTSSTVTVTASFGYSLSVSTTGTGAGTITSGDGFINCGATCSFAYPATDAITLTAAATTGSYFTGWTGCTTSSGTTCHITIGTAASSVVANFVPGNTLTVTKSGTGTGTVTSADTNINCGSTCSATYAPSTVVVLTASPASGSTFTGWTGGGCSGTSTCTVTLAAATSVTAVFDTPIALTITKSGTGTGTVTSADSNINCGATCSYSYNPSTSVVLTATPASGSIFTGWSGGGCTGTSTCTVSVTAATTVTANFVLPVTLTVAKAGTGTGTVTSADANINCGATCSYNYSPSTAVVLTATAASGSVFTGWSGGGCTGTSTCSVTITAATTVTATFTPSVTLTVAASPTAGGTITSADTHINCGATCSASYTSGTALVLTATPASGYNFTGWSGGGCTGTSTCSITITAATSVTAAFTLAPTYTSTPTSSTLTIARGSSGTATLNFALNNGWTGTFSNFGCSVANITCSGSTVNATSGTSASGAVTIAVASTFSQSMVPANLPNPNRTLPIAFAMLAFPALLLPFTFRKRRNFRAINLALTFIAVLGLSQLLTGCGGNAAATPPTPTSRTVSVPITYTATQTGGTATTGAPVTVSVTVTF